MNECICDCFRLDGNADADFIDSTDAASSSNAMDDAQKIKMMKKQLRDWNARGIRTTSATL